MKSKDFVLQYFPDACCKKEIERFNQKNILGYLVIVQKFIIGHGETESSAWVDAKKFLQQHGTNPDKW